MATTQDDIRRWLARGEEQDATHLIVVVDGFDHEDYPVYVHANEKVREIYDQYNGKDMQRVMEVYSYALDLESQIAEHRSFHFEERPASANSK